MKLKDFTVEADALYAQGNYTQALLCYRKLSKEPKVDQQIRLCLLHLARRFWKQGKTAELKKVIEDIGGDDQLALAHANLCGQESLRAFAQSTNSFLATLAACRAQNNPKTALLTLRQSPDWKQIAEGWIAILKGDPQKALESFGASTLSLALYAQLGKAIAFLLQGHRAKAQELLQSLKPFAGQRFPHLAKAIGWMDSEKAPQGLSTQLLHAPLNQLIEEEKKTNPIQKMRKGLLWLRIGDQSSDASAWDLAMKWHPPLRLDVFKRRFLLSRDDPSLEADREFFQFLHALCKEKPHEAKLFLEYLALEKIQYVESYLQEQQIKNGRGQWTIQPPSPALQLLWFFLVYQETLDIFDRALIFPESLLHQHLYSDLNMTELSWEQLFQTLDREYEQTEKYLRKKLSLVRLLKKPLPICQIIAKMLTLNPHSIDKWMPLYVQQMIVRIKAEETPVAEVEALRTIFPRSFDLLRLSYWLCTNEDQRKTLLASCRTHLSEPLFAILQCQCLIDQGVSFATMKNKELSLIQIGQSLESDQRFAMMLCEAAASCPKAFLTKTLKAIAPDLQTKDTLTRFLRSYEITMPLEILESWVQKNKTDWRPHYALALYHAKNNEQKACLEKLEESIDLIPTNTHELECSIIESTLFLCTTQAEAINEKTNPFTILKRILSSIGKPL